LLAFFFKVDYVKVCGCCFVLGRSAAKAIYRIGSDWSRAPIGAEGNPLPVRFDLIDWVADECRG